MRRAHEFTSRSHAPRGNAYGSLQNLPNLLLHTLRACPMGSVGIHQNGLLLL